MLSADVRRFDGKEASYTFNYEERTLIAWWALPMIWTVDRSLKNLTRHLLLNMRRDGFFEKPGS